MAGDRPTAPLLKLEICVDGNDPHALADFWSAALGYGIGEGDGDPYIDLVPPRPELPVVYVQRVPEPKTAKTRIHLDLYVPDGPAEVTRLLGLGATTVAAPVVGSSGSWSFQVLADPQGTEFCVCQDEG